MKYGILHGVGVGPGAPDLITVRAVNILKSVPVIAIPRRSEWDRSLAWQIAEPNIGDISGQERLFLTFPMTKDPETLQPAWNCAFKAIGERLEQGRDVAFITQGDPMVYSTFIYLAAEAPLRWPGISIVMTPAVSSITAIASTVGIPLADGQESIAVLPATYGVEGLAEILKRFDTVVLMKVSSVMPAVIDVLEREGLLERAIYISKATTAQQTVIRDLRSIRNDRCDYFSIVLVSRKERDGVLAGRPDRLAEEIL